MPTWLLLALLSMFFAGMTAVLAKFGLKEISADLGLVVRTAVVFGIILINFLLWQPIRSWQTLTPKTIGFLVASGLTTSLSWIFYYKAIKIGQVSTVALIDKGSIVLTILLSYLLLGEIITPRMLLGLLLVLSGLIVLIWP